MPWRQANSGTALLDNYQGGGAGAALDEQRKQVRLGVCCLIAADPLISTQYEEEKRQLKQREEQLKAELARVSSAEEASKQPTHPLSVRINRVVDGSSFTDRPRPNRIRLFRHRLRAPFLDRSLALLLVRHLP